MTREEAVEQLRNLKKANFYPSTIIALDIAIEALTQESTQDLISRESAIAEFWDGRDVYDIMESIEELPSAPSAEAESRLYIKIYADDEPSVMAEKLYQICGETQNREVAKWLKEYFPSAPDSRQRGEWVRKYDGHINCYWYECDQCGEYRPRNQFGHEYNANFCPNCGSRMYKGGEDE